MSHPNKHFNVASALFLCWCKVETSDNVKYERWNEVVYVNVGIYNVEKRWNNVVILSFNFCNIGQRQNNFVDFPISKEPKNNGWAKKIMTFFSFKWNSFKLNNLNSKFSSLFSPFQRIFVETFFKSVKIFKTLWICCVTKAIFKPFHFV